VHYLNVKPKLVSEWGARSKADERALLAAVETWISPR
jgi:hypothetical protein